MQYTSALFSSRTMRRSSPLFIIMLGLLSALPPFGTDAGLPGLPSLQATFSVDAVTATHTLTLFLLGFSLGPVLFGPLSDQFGRKPVMLFGVALFTVAGLGCAKAPSMDALLALRVVQGVGAGAAAALPAAIVRDVFHGDAALSRQSYVALVNAVAPLIAPLAGAALLALGDWRSIYQTLAVVGASLFILCAFGYRETAPARGTTSRGSGVLQAALLSYKRVLSNPRYMLSTAMLASTFGTMFAYITGSSSVFMTMLGASSTAYGALFALTACGTICGATANGRLAARYGAGSLLAVGVTGNLIAGGLLLGAGCLGVHSIAVVAACVVASNFSAGIVMPNVTYEALKEVPTVAGSASALQRALQMVVGAASGALLGVFSGNRLVVMAAVMTVFAAITLCLFLVRRGSESTPLSASAGHPPTTLDCDRSRDTASDRLPELTVAVEPAPRKATAEPVGANTGNLHE
ncbi:multidrug effflux MFS transporter [Paraburkholderia youngii]|uniref:multidrug effflux MFS transporter n=1 Tax=Paraburkholderia youngii TaxID=2782701 RepID=UPI003D1BE9B3